MAILLLDNGWLFLWAFPLLRVNYAVHVISGCVSALQYAIFFLLIKAFKGQLKGRNFTIKWIVIIKKCSDKIYFFNKNDEF